MAQAQSRAPAPAPWPLAPAAPAPLQDLLVVGGGLTGFALAAALPRALQARSVVADKSNSPGRLTVNRARGAAAPSVCDLGAQYFTAYDARSAAMLAELEAAALVARMPAGAVRGARGNHEARAHFVATRGTAAVVDAHLLPRAAAGGATVRRGVRIAALEVVAAPPGESAGGGAAVWRATDEAGGAALFRACALALPAPQVLQLGGDAPRVLAVSGLAPLLGAVAFSARFAVALYFAAESRDFFEAALPWPELGRFVGRDEPGGDMLRYIAFESRKRQVGTGAGAGAGAGANASAGAAEAQASLSLSPLAEAADTEAAGRFPSFIVHSTVEFGALHTDAPDFQKVLGPGLVAAACAALARAAGLAPGAALPHAPVETRVHRWKYSQMTAGVPAGALEAAAGAAAAAGAGVEVSVADEGAAVAVRGVTVGAPGGAAAGLPSPPLIVAGDWLAESNMAGCLRSAEAATALATAALGRA